MVLADAAGNIWSCSPPTTRTCAIFDLVVPRGCVASNPGAANTATLAQMADILHPFRIPRLAGGPRRPDRRAGWGYTTASRGAMHRGAAVSRARRTARKILEVDVQLLRKFDQD